MPYLALPPAPPVVATLAPQDVSHPVQTGAASGIKQTTKQNSEPTGTTAKPASGQPLPKNPGHAATVAISTPPERFPPETSSTKTAPELPVKTDAAALGAPLVTGLTTDQNPSVLPEAIAADQASDQATDQAKTDQVKIGEPSATLVKPSSLQPALPLPGVGAIPPWSPSNFKPQSRASLAKSGSTVKVERDRVAPHPLASRPKQNSSRLTTGQSLPAAVSLSLSSLADASEAALDASQSLLAQYRVPQGPTAPTVDPSPAPGTPQELQIQPTVPTLPPTEPTSSPASTPFPPASPAPAESVPAVPATPRNPAGATPLTPPPEVPQVVELKADRQEYDEQRKVFTAEGNVVMRFRQSVLDADRLQVNLNNQIAVAEGNVALTRGQQVLRGTRFVYNFVQGTGTVGQASGEIYLPTSGSDLNPNVPTVLQPGGVASQPVSDRITANQPQQNVSSPGGASIVVGAGRNVQSANNQLSSGQVKRLRFEAAQIQFTPDGWEATNVRITNDPFSPPELELRAKRATLTRLSPLRDELKASNPRLVFDQGFSLPLLRSRVVIDRRKREPGLVQFGYDGGDRGGLFIQRTFEPISTDRFRLSLTPQYFIQKSFTDNGGNPLDPSLYGLRANLDANFSPTTSIRGSAVFTTLDFSDLENKLRASVRARQLIGTHTLALEYSYRDRLFNGSLGFQTVQSSLGAILTSPLIYLGKTGIYLKYQGGVQYINSETDRFDLLDPIRTNNRISLTRFQGAVEIGRFSVLWRGKALPATATEGMRYTPNPITPYLGLATGAQGILSGYSSGDNQGFASGSIGLYGQFGHFSKPFFDYTAFNVTYSQGVRSGSSPFLFDRSVDTRVLSAGISQQIYGPIRVEVQTAINLDTGREISTDYFLRYNRRTYAIVLRYNPTLELGSLNLQINDFNWTGGAEPFSGSDVRFVQGGVSQDNE